MNYHRVVGVVVLCIGALLVANPLYLYQYPDERNTVAVGNYLDQSPRANYTYEELSPDAQRLVRTAIESEDNFTRFHGDHRRPEEFRFSTGDENGSFAVVGGVYRVEYQGRNYTISTFEQPPIQEESRRSQGLVGYGLVLAVVGTIYLWRDQDSAVGPTLGAVGVVLLAFNALYRFAPDALGGLNVLGSAVFILVALLFAIASGGYLVFKTMRERRLSGTA